MTAAKLIPWGLIIQGGQAAVKALLELSPEKRLLYITADVFSEQTGLTRKEMYAWLDEDEIGDLLVGVVQGNAAGDEAVQWLTDLIAPRLENTPEPDRKDVAGEMADFMVTVAPRMGNDLQDAVAHIANRLDLVMRALPKEGDGDAEVNAAAALVRGPLVEVGMEAKARQARELAEQGASAAAAQAFVEIAEALQKAGLDIVAENYLELAGELFGSNGNAEEAARILREVAENQVSRGAGGASLTIGRLEKALPPDRMWEASALHGRLDFAIDPEGALEALRIASENAAGGPTAMKHLANYTDLLSIAMEHDRVLDVTEPHATSNPDNEAELMVQLDRLDALSAVGPAEADEAWGQLLVNLALGDEPAWDGIAWQRRGARLARDGDVQRSHDAYQRAMAAFARISGYEEQVADAFYSLQSVSLANAAPLPDQELRALAYAQRGSAATPVAKASQLERIGMDQRLAGRLPDALRHYALAAALHRRAGSLQGQLEVSGKLGELMSGANEPAKAAWHFIAAGQQKEAVANAEAARAEDLIDALRPGGSRWERAVKLAVLAAVGERLSPDFVAELGPWVRDEAGAEPDSLMAPQPAHQARLALPAIALGLPEDQLEETWGLLKRDLGLGLGAIDVSRAAGRALEHATVLGLVDATPELLADFLSDPYNSRVGVEWLGQRIKTDAEGRDQVLAAERSAPVVAVLEIAGLVQGNNELEKSADAIADGLAKARNVEQKEGQISIGFGHNYAMDGIASRGASEEARSRAVERLVEMLNDPQDSEMNRASAATALFNLASAIPAGDAEETVNQLLPAARGEYPLSEWDHNIDHPFSRMRISTHTQAALWAASLEAVGRVVEAHGSIRDDFLEEPIDIAMQRGPDNVLAAATDTLARVPTLDMPVPIEVLLAHDDTFVRIAALRCWTVRRDGLPKGPLLESLRTDASIGVRHNLAVMAAEVGDTAELERFAADDEHALIRRTAEMKLREIAAAQAN